MNHTTYKKLVCLLASGELDGDERSMLTEHLASCRECRQELEQMKKVHMMAQAAKVEINDALLGQVRRNLHAELVRLKTQRTLRERLAEAVSGVFVRPGPRFAFGGVVMTAFGIMIGYWLFSPPHSGIPSAVIPDTSIVRYLNRTDGAIAAVTQDSTRSENIRIIHADEGSGVVEFVFDAVTPVHVSGRMDDHGVQRVLARALTGDENAGVRLRAMTVIASQTEHQPAMSAEIQKALLTALKKDDNPAVRRQAVTALQPLTHDAEVQRALAFALVHDKNSGVRIAAVNALAAASLAGRPIDTTVLKDLKDRMQHDNNIFIRNQSRNVLEEASQL